MAKPTEDVNSWSDKTTNEQPGKQLDDQRSPLAGHNSQQTVKRMAAKAPGINQAKGGDEQINPGTCDFNQRDLGNTL